MRSSLRRAYARTDGTPWSCRRACANGRYSKKPDRTKKIATPSWLRSWIAMGAREREATTWNSNTNPAATARSPSRSGNRGFPGGGATASCAIPSRPAGPTKPGLIWAAAMGGPIGIQDLARWPHRGHLATVEPQNPLRDLGHLIEAVADEDHGSTVAMQSLDL